jgi:hypothetical protein
MNKQKWFGAKKVKEPAVSSPVIAPTQVVVQLPQPTSIKAIKYVQYPWELKSHWGHIINVLNTIGTVSSITHVEKILLDIKNQQNFEVGVLKFVLEKHMDENELQTFFDTFNFIIKLVRDSPQIFQDVDVRVLARYPVEISDHQHVPRIQKIELERNQIACLLANAVLSTYQRNGSWAFSSDHHIPSINFDSLFELGQSGTLDSRVAKIKMIFHYFERISQHMPTGHVTFIRQSLWREDFPNWSTCEKTLTSIQVFPKGVIEDAPDALQADFANQFIGGGVLRGGAVQEEIRFCNNPECIVSRLFCEEMAANEVVFIRGSEQFSKHEGYAKTLQYGGDYVDTNVDENGNLKTEIVAFDALVFMKDPTIQWEQGNIDRELNKAYCAFHGGTSKIATGNWGCGAFRGDKELKAIIQWLAASVAERELLYYTFGDEKLSQGLEQLVKRCGKVTVGQVYKVIIRLVEKQTEKEAPSAFKQMNELLDEIEKSG